MPGVIAVVERDRLLDVEAPAISSAAINTALVEAGITVDELRIDRASLEDTFLQLTTQAQAQAQEVEAVA